MNALLPRPSSVVEAQAWEIDQQTGMLEGKHGGTGPPLLLTVSKKLELLDILKDKPLLVTEACEKIGINRRTFDLHLRVDQEFYRRYQELIGHRVEKVEQNLFNRAEDPKGNILATMAVLNAFKRERYQPSMRVEVAGQIDHKHMMARVARLKDVVDARLFGEVES